MTQGLLYRKEDDADFFIFNYINYINLFLVEKKGTS